MVAVAGINPVVSPSFDAAIGADISLLPVSSSLQVSAAKKVSFAPASSAGPSPSSAVSSSVRSVFSSYGAVLSAAALSAGVVEFAPGFGESLSFVSSDSAPVPVSVSSFVLDLSSGSTSLPVSPLLSVSTVSCVCMGASVCASA